MTIPLIFDEFLLIFMPHPYIHARRVYSYSNKLKLISYNYYHVFLGGQKLKPIRFGSSFET